ncbi:MAG: hypothetical protein EWM51_06840 [Treponema sp.]|nr:MAG: hypothetical protein EWM51_06840 [Treponema sp.]
MGKFQQDRSSLFLDQSVRDSPCRVRLTGKDSLFSLSRWSGSVSLSFGTEGDYRGKTIVRGNEILLKPEATPKTHHVFRRLDGDRFEYDVVLLREPETNVVSIDLSVPDGLEFFRQPTEEAARRKGIRCAPEVFDSYAVYWKERNGRFKTGKFCHIYRPRIRDARGREVWGRLEITGRVMTVTIPEEWLADAAYPVVVDPVIGTQTRGALNTIDWNNEDNPHRFYLELQMGMSKFIASSAIAGICTSYIYSYCSDDANGQAVIFSDLANFPGTRLSRNEVIVDLDTTTEAWIPSTFTLSRTISPGEAFWYGYNAKYGVYTYYDVGGTFRKMWTEGYDDVPETFSDYGEVWSVIMSAYFSYTSPATYTRTCTGNAGLTGSASRRAGVARISSASVGANLAVNRCVGLNRMSSGSVSVGEIKKTIFAFTRVLADMLDVKRSSRIFQRLIRFCTSAARPHGEITRSIWFSRFVESAFKFIERMLPRMILKKEELVFVSRITRNIEIRSTLV